MSKVGIDSKPTRVDFGKYLFEQGYTVNQEKTDTDTKAGMWFEKTIPIDNERRLIVLVRSWLIIDVFTHIEDDSIQYKGAEDVYAVNVENHGYSPLIFEIGLMIASSNSIADYRVHSGNADWIFDLAKEYKHLKLNVNKKE